MKRQLQNQVRRSFRTIRRKLSRVRDRAATYVRTRSSFNEPHTPLRVSSMIERTRYESDHDSDDDVFESSEEFESSREDTEPDPVIYIPCEFCHVQKIDSRLDRHQNACSLNPNRIRRRRHSSSNDVSRRRVVSEAAAVPSAPPRSRSSSPPSRSSSPPSRSSSPTRGYPVPISLLCPITHSIFRNPVVANDGYTYERDAILHWLGHQSSRESPVTRELIFRDKLNPNRLIKGLVENFLSECEEKSLRYKYRLDVHLKKTTSEPFIKTGRKSVYHAEWIKQRRSTTGSEIILIHFTGEHAEQLSELLYSLPPHSNIAPILGRVEHPDSGILLVQEYSPTQTLSQLMRDSNERLTIATLDLIVYQIASAFQHLEKSNISHTKITADHFLVYRLDNRTDKTLIKLVDIDITNELNATDIRTFGELVQELYTLAFENNEEKAQGRQSLFQCCLASDPNDRPTLDQLIDILTDLIEDEKSKSFV